MFKTFYFNTGVNQYGFNSGKLSRGQIWRNGTKQIPFDCADVPERAVFLFACDNPDLKKGQEGFIVREILNSALLSKFAYFSSLTR